MGGHAGGPVAVSGRRRPGHVGGQQDGGAAAALAIRSVVQASPIVYRQWLEGAVVKGMRPLYRSLKDECSSERPFAEQPLEIRPYKRREQWKAIWCADRTPDEELASLQRRLRERAIAQAASLPPLDPAEVSRRIRKMAIKSPARMGGPSLSCRVWMTWQYLRQGSGRQLLP